MAGGSSMTKRMSADEKRKTILDIYHSTKSVFTEKEIVTLATKAGVNSNTVIDVNQSLVDDGLVDKEKIGGSNFFWSFPAKKDRLMQIQLQTVRENIEKLQQQVQEANHQLEDAKRGREEEDINDHEKEKTTEEEPANHVLDKVENGCDDNNNEGGGNSNNAGGARDLHNNSNNNTSSKEAASQPTSTSTGRAAKLQRLQNMAVERSTLQAEYESLKENDPQALADLEKELKLVTEAAHRWTDNIFNCKSYLTKKRGMDRKEADKVLGITSAFDYPDDKGTKKVDENRP